MSLTIDIKLMRHRMDEMHLTYASLADKSGVSLSTIKRIFNGTPTTYATVALLATALKLTADELAPTADDPEMSLNGSNDEEMDMKYVIQTLERLYLGRIDDLKSHCEYTRKGMRVVAIVAIALMTFICTLFTVDLMNPTVGWFRA